jgi:hypothetical protein
LLQPINDNHPFLSNGQPDPTYTPTIGDRLDDAGVSWRWYSGGWSDALAGQPAGGAFGGGFQFHHQPFAYYANFAPFNADGTPNASTDSLLNPNAHLQDETQFFADLSSSKLPAVSFIKPLGPDNEHPGYANLLEGQQHVADIVHAIQNNPQWAHTAIIITYDENGGFWDHVSPPTSNGIWGDGTRVPAIVISPYAKTGYVDHTQHDTLSILKTVEDRFKLEPLTQFDAQASSLASDFTVPAHASLGLAYLQRDASDPSKFALIIGGSEGTDHIQITQDDATKLIHVTIKGPDTSVDKTFDVSRVSRLEVYAQGGNDHIQIGSNVMVPSFVFGGGGNNHIVAGGGPGVIVGGPGNDVVSGGAAPSILIGGAGSDNIRGRSGSDLVIAGSTAFDANLEALEALLAEWDRTDIKLPQKVADLTGGSVGALNGPYLLNATTVIDDGNPDRLEGSAGLGNLFFAHVAGTARDQVKRGNPNDIVVKI